MAKITTTEAIKISTQIDGEAVELDLTPGVNDVPDHIAELLIAQNFATPGTTASKKTAPVEPTPTPIEETPEA